MPKKSLQQTYAKDSICFGCGPANPEGLHINSFIEDNTVIARWQPKPHHHAFPNILCGGVVGTLLDCHCNWTAAWYFMQTQKLSSPPSTVTAEYQIKLLRPTPMDTELLLKATLVNISGNKASINGELFANNALCDTCHGVFVAVKESHPAFHRWK